MKAFALGLGLNDEALTFNRLAIVFGEAGLAEFLVAPFAFWFVLVEVPFAVTGVLEVVVMALESCLPLSFPLNGGIVWMTMLIFFEVVPSAGLAVAAVAAAAEAAAALAIFCALAAVIDACALLDAILEPSACVIGLRFDSEFLAPATGKPRDAVVGLEAPMARAWEEAASLLAFSIIARCFSSSFARIGTRSSGIGLFSCRSYKLRVLTMSWRHTLKFLLNLTNSAMRLSISLLTSACRF